MADYNILNKGEWATHLYTCDTESCFLSCIAPCHVYAKIKSYGKNKREYFIHLVVYMVMYISIQQLWYSQQYLNSHMCPSHLTDNCISITDDCDKYYMKVDNVLSSCMIKNNICVYDSHECLSSKDTKQKSTAFLVVTLIGYSFLVFLHYNIREKIKVKQTIGGNIIEDVLAITCCSTCGLAQEYREL
jgi:Cys-rich protein (TIGR01571 family)